VFSLELYILLSMTTSMTFNVLDLVLWAEKILKLKRFLVQFK